MPKTFLSPRLFFVASCLFFAFFFGFATSHCQWFPHSLLAPALDEWRRISSPARYHAHPAKHDLLGVVAYDDHGPASPVGETVDQSGLTLLTSQWADNEGRAGIRLIDRRGEVVHTWNLDPAEQWSDSPYYAGRRNPYVHGTYLFDNGDVLFNLEYLGLTRMSASGEVRWQLSRQTHHSIHRGDDGNFWVCDYRWSDAAPEMERKYPGLIPPFGEDRVINISPDGQVLREVSILDLVYNSEHRSILWKAKTKRTGDVLHLNDVEPLSAAMADQYPMFDAGDLLVSLCWVSFVFVFDPDTGEIKWSSYGETAAQHDPDFIGDGWISIFDNRPDDSFDGRFLGGSRLIAIRPHTGETRQIYPPLESGSAHERQFHTPIGGKAQLLPNGHWLLTDAQWGRVFEIDQRGYTVWEWGHERHDDGWISEVLEGTRYPLSPDAVRQWANR